MTFLALDNSPLIGKGSSRRCYQHPEDMGKCVKVQKNPSLNITAEELKHYRKLQRRGISWEMVARFHETVSTEQGPGAVFDMPRDADGSVSRTLHHYLQEPAAAVDPGGMADALGEFRRYLLTQNIVVRELKPQNLVWQRMAGGAARFVLIDGIGNNQFLPVATYLKRFGRRVIGRKWATFVRDLRDLYPESPLARELFVRL